MKSLNRCEFMGYIGADAEVRQTQAGTRVANFSLGVTHTWTAEGAKQEHTEWIRCVAWDSKARTLATLVGQYVKKGMPVYVEGRMQSREWEHASGVKMRSWELVIRDVIFLPDGKNRAPASPSPSDATPATDEPLALPEDDDETPF